METTPIIDAAWTGWIVLWLVLSPLVGAALMVVVRRPSPAVLRSLAVSSGLCTAFSATVLHVCVHEAPDAARYAVGTFTRPVLTIPREAPATDSASAEPWLEVVFSVGVDQLNAAALLWIPWFAVSALLVAEPSADRGFHAVFLAWEACLLGSFAASDALTFCAFQVGALCWGYCLTAGWGQSDRRAAADSFCRWQFSGLAAWWTALVALGVVTAWCRRDLLAALPTLSWTWTTFAHRLPLAIGQSPVAAHYWQLAATVLFVLFVFGVLVRTPVWPLHAWFPPFVDAALAPVTMLATAAWCPLGLYAWVRFVAPIFRESTIGFGGGLVLIGGVTAVWAGVTAFSQTDLRRFGAYAFLSLQGIAWLSAATASADGARGAAALCQAAGFGAAAWFVFVALWERRSRSSHVESIAGLAWRAPRLGAALIVIAIGCCGFPAVGRWHADVFVLWTLASHRPWGLAAAVVGWLFVGWGTIRVVGRMFTTSNLPAAAAHDLSWSELLALAPPLAWCLWNWWAPLEIPMTGM